MKNYKENIRVSHSSLEKMDGCPKQLFYEKTVGSPEETSRPLVEGKIGHKIFECALLDKIDGISSWGDNRDEFFEEYCLEAIKANKDGIKAIGKKDYKKIEENFHNYYLHVLTIVDSIEPIATEQKFEIPYWKDESITLSGIIDCIATVNDINAIIDLKTGTRKLSEDKIYKGTQGQMYFEACASMPFDINSVQFIQIQRMKDSSLELRAPIEFTPTKVTRLNLENKIDTYVHMLKNDLFPMNGEHCWAYGKRCPFYDRCLGEIIGHEELPEGELPF